MHRIGLLLPGRHNTHSSSSKTELRNEGGCTFWGFIATPFSSSSSKRLECDCHSRTHSPSPSSSLAKHDDVLFGQSSNTRAPKRRNVLRTVLVASSCMAFYLIVQQFAAVLQKQIIGGSAQQRKRVFKFEYSKFVGSCSAIMEGIRIFQDRIVSGWMCLLWKHCCFCFNGKPDVGDLLWIIGSNKEPWFVFLYVWLILSALKKNNGNGQKFGKFDFQEIMPC